MTPPLICTLVVDCCEIPKPDVAGFETVEDVAKAKIDRMGPPVNSDDIIESRLKLNAKPLEGDLPLFDPDAPESKGLDLVDTDSCDIDGDTADPARYDVQEETPAADGQVGGFAKPLDAVDVLKSSVAEPPAPELD